MPSFLPVYVRDRINPESWAIAADPPRRIREGLLVDVTTPDGTVVHRGVVKSVEGHKRGFHKFLIGDYGFSGRDVYLFVPVQHSRPRLVKKLQYYLLYLTLEPLAIIPPTDEMLIFEFMEAVTQ